MPTLLVLLAALITVALGGSTAAVSAINRTVVSITFDDGRASQIAALPLLQSHGMHATFYLNSNKIGGTDFLSWSQVDDLADAGNEIGGHTLDHVNLASLYETDPTEAARQICDDRAALLAHVSTVTSFAYPFGDSDDSSAGDTSDALAAIVHDCGYTSARITQGILGSAPWCSTAGCPTAESIPPWDAFDIRATGSVTDTTTLADLESFVIQAEENGGGWVPFVFHDIGAGADDYWISQTDFDSFLSWLSARESSGTVVRTVGEVMSGSEDPILGPNLLQNSSLESISTPGALPDCWETPVWGDNSGEWIVTSDAHSGAAAVEGTVTSRTSGDRKLLVTRSAECAPAVVPGHTYRMTGWYKGSLTPFVAVYWRDDSGSWQEPSTSPEFRQSDDWRQAVWTTSPAPAGATAVSVGFAVAGTGQIIFDEIELGDTAGPPPTVQISAPGAGSYVSGSAVTLAADASDSNGIQSVKFAVDGETVETDPFDPYSYSWDSASVADGEHALTATATNANDLQSSDSVTFTVDNTAPDVSITSGPSDPSNSTAASFALSSSDGSATFLCSLDGADYSECSSPQDYSGLAEGLHAFSAKAVDPAGNGSEAATREWSIDVAAPTGALTAPASDSFQRQTITLQSNSTDEGSGVASVSFQRLPAGESIWVTIDIATSSPYDAGWNTASVGDGRYDLRVVTTDAAGNRYASPSVSVTVDNTDPTGALVAPAPGSFLRQKITLASTFTDEGSGVTSVAFQSSPTGKASWTAIGSDTQSPYSATWDTAAVSDGSHNLRAVARDRAGNTFVSATVTVTVDNTPPTGSLVAPAPGSVLRRRLALGAASTDAGSGVASVVFQIASSRAGAWQSEATVRTAPWKATLSLANGFHGSYLLRAITYDRAGNAFVSAARKVRLDNAVPASSILCNGRACRGTFTKRVKITIRARDLGSGVRAVRYTLNGKKPTASSKRFRAPLRLATTRTVRWKVWDKAGNVSRVRSRVIRVKPSARQSR